MAADHAALVRGLERDGPAVLREHLGESAAALVAAEAGHPGGRAVSATRPPGREEGVGARSGDMRSAYAMDFPDMSTRKHVVCQL